MFNKNNHVMKLVIISLLIALEILLTRIFCIQTPLLRISFGFLPPALTAMLYGPLWAGAAYALGDLIGGYLLSSGPFFFGFTFTAFLTGLVFGIMFYNKKPGICRCIIASGIISFIINLCLDTLWLYILMREGLIAILPIRILKICIMFPVIAFTCYFFQTKVISKISGIQTQ